MYSGDVCTFVSPCRPLCDVDGDETATVGFHRSRGVNLLTSHVFDSAGGPEAGNGGVGVSARGSSGVRQSGRYVNELAGNEHHWGGCLRADPGRSDLIGGRDVLVRFHLCFYGVLVMPKVGCCGIAGVVKRWLA